MSGNLSELPSNLPAPVDDGASDHLLGMHVPPIPLMSTNNHLINLARVSKEKRTIVYCYPLTGRPDQELPANWDTIPGARGCTPQTCEFRDHYQEIQNLNAQVFGLSTQTTEYQREMVKRLNVPFEILSDVDLAFAQAMKLPTFEAEGIEMLKRLTLIIYNGEIIKVFYPVFPPDKNAAEVFEWLSQNN
ncbi:MAG: hypothetical protein NVSMB56_08930 [Pyrinomonadaceae bacterium]